MVSTMVRMTTSVAPKLLARSARREESNNIVRFSEQARIMDFRHQSASLDALAAVACDALLVVVAGDKVDASVDVALRKLVDDAIAHGDFELKRGKTVYLHRPQGVKAARV